MYRILDILYENEISIYEYVYLQLVNLKHNKGNNKNKIIINTFNKLNLLLVELNENTTSILNENQKDDEISRYEEIQKFLNLEKYINLYIANLKNEFVSNINTYKLEIINNPLLDIVSKNKSLSLDNTFKDEQHVSKVRDITSVVLIDKFYTNIHIVKNCLLEFANNYNLQSFDLVIEPSAGSGNFLLNIDHNNKIGLDIYPEHETIIEQDFFTYFPYINDNKTPPAYKNILTIGNPPFGKICSLAIKFFNHAAIFSNVIAFIIPRSFRKKSIQNKLDNRFHLTHDIDISTKSNTFSPSINVKCCFQIWEKNNNLRQIEKLDLKHKDWNFLNYKKDNILDSDFAIRAYGGNCGEICIYNFESLNPKGWHFIKSNIEINLLKNNFLSLDFINSTNTARQNSLGKSELIELYKKNK
jgi:hypothetical protein